MRSINRHNQTNMRQIQNNAELTYPMFLEYPNLLVVCAMNTTKQLEIVGALSPRAANDLYI